MAAEELSIAVSSINDALSNLEKKYVEKFEQQQILINKLQAEIDELQSYDQIDQILDEVHGEQKYDDDNNESKDNIDDNKITLIRLENLLLSW